MKQILAVFEDIKKFSESAEFIPTGFSKLDTELDGGFMKKELEVIGGFTGVGKSMIAGHLILVAARKGYKCAYFSLEISNEMIISRLVGQEGNLKPARVMAGLLDKQEYEQKIKAQNRLAVYNDQMFFDDSSYKLKDISDIIVKNNFDYVIIDFIQNIMEKGDEYEKLSKISLELQKLAKAKNCCIVVLSQLSNSAFKTDALEYKGSGSIATVCDLGMFLLRNEDAKDQLILKVRKNRRGRSNIEVDLKCLYPGGRIVEL